MLLVALATADDNLRMNKIYLRIDGVLHYHEAWVADSLVVEHWGVVGERGETAEHKRATRAKAKEAQAVADTLKPALDKGYALIADEDHAVLLIEYAIDGMGTGADLKKRHDLEERMNETLGWTGLGECDGGEIGSGTMEVCCFVVDFDIAQRVITADLAGTPFADFTRIHREDVE